VHAAYDFDLMVVFCIFFVFLLVFVVCLSLLLIGAVRAEPEMVLSQAWVQSPARLNKLFQDYWRACCEINFSADLTVSSIIGDRWRH